jgi:tetratricopeptide (TPR) repeat protein
VLYFTLNKSYRLSLEARYYFENGEYDKAFVKAKEAYILDPYNRMAFTVYTQSKIAKEWVNFLEDSNKYFKEIEAIANKPKITDKERQKVKIMLEILLDEYKNLKPSLLIGEELKLKARQQYEKAKEIYEKVFAKRD